MPSLRHSKTVQMLCLWVAILPIAGCGHKPDPAGSVVQPKEGPSVAVTKAPRAPIYDPAADAPAVIAAAVQRAALENKRVLIEWGGNWCGWCYKLHDVFHTDPVVKPLVAEEYELVLIDSNSNMELLKKHGGENTQFAYPHLTILDSQGEVLTNQETGSLEIGDHHDPQKVAAFLSQWKVVLPPAQEQLNAALSRAKAEEKRVFLRVGDPYCGWCKVLARFVHNHQATFDKDYIDLKLDTTRMVGGVEVTKAIQHQFSTDVLGHPWMAILDADGKVQAHSVLPNSGNIGYPYKPAEIAAFIEMLRSTGRAITNEELEGFRNDLNKFREEREKKNAALE